MIQYKLFLLIIPECERGFYGIECSETCGHCGDVSQCSNVNGTCLSGCDAGFKGDLCKTGKEHISGTRIGTKAFLFIL